VKQQSRRWRATSLFLCPDGWERKLRRSIPNRQPREIFSDGLVDRPAKGIWRITQAGRDYLYLLESPLEFEEAAE